MRKRLGPAEKALRRKATRAKSDTKHRVARNAYARQWAKLNCSKRNAAQARYRAQTGTLAELERRVGRLEGKNDL